MLSSVTSFVRALDLMYLNRELYNILLFILQTFRTSVLVPSIALRGHSTKDYTLDY